MTDVERLVVVMLFSGISFILTDCLARNPKVYEFPLARSVTSYMGDTVSDLGKEIDCIMQDKNGHYWFASNGDGVFRYDGKTLLHITSRHGLCSNFVWSVQQDINGDIWFATRDGFCCFNGKSITDYTDRIKNAPYGSLHYRKGGLFFGHLNGVCFYDGRSFENFTIHPDHYHPDPGDMNRPYAVYSTLADRMGNVWFGTQSKGVCVYDGMTFSCLTGQNLDGPAVRSMFQDRSGGLWFGNNGGGLYRYDGKTLRNITEEKGLGNPEFLKGRFNDKPGSLARVWSINEDDNGLLWIGTIDAGVWTFDGFSLKNYTMRDGLPGYSIRAIFKDNKGELWFVVNGDAVCKFNGRKFARFEFHP